MLDDGEILIVTTHVLIVEDEEGLRTTLAKHLALKGLKILIAEDVQGAIKILRNQKVDVLLTDLRLGGQDGIDLLRMLPELSPQTRPILMSAFASARDYQEAMRLGAVQVLCKPFTRSEFAAAIQKATESQKGYQAQVHGLSLTDILQMFHYARRNMVMVITGHPSGEIYMQEGEVVHAVMNGGEEGLNALKILLNAPSGALQTQVLPENYKQHSIDVPFGMLLLDMIRLLDEDRAKGSKKSEPIDDYDDIPPIEVVETELDGSSQTVGKSNTRDHEFSKEISMIALNPPEEDDDLDEMLWRDDEFLDDYDELQIDEEVGSELETVDFSAPKPTPEAPLSSIIKRSRPPSRFGVKAPSNASLRQALREESLAARGGFEGSEPTSPVPGIQAHESNRVAPERIFASTHKDSLPHSTLPTPIDEFDAVPTNRIMYLGAKSKNNTSISLPDTIPPKQAISTEDLKIFMMMAGDHPDFDLSGVYDSTETLPTTDDAEIENEVITILPQEAPSPEALKELMESAESESEEKIEETFSSLKHTDLPPMEEGHDEITSAAEANPEESSSPVKEEVSKEDPSSQSSKDEETSSPCETVAESKNIKVFTPQELKTLRLFTRSIIADFPSLVFAGVMSLDRCEMIAHGGDSELKAGIPFLSQMLCQWSNGKGILELSNHLKEAESLMEHSFTKELVAFSNGQMYLMMRSKQSNDNVLLCISESQSILHRLRVSVRRKADACQLF